MAYRTTFPPTRLKGTYLPAGTPGEVSVIFRFATLPNSNGQMFLGNTYRQVISMLQAAGFFGMQYSDYVNANTPAWFAWATMWNLPNIQPPGKFEWTLMGLKMHHIYSLAVQDFTPLIQLGGAHASVLRGPIPRDLVLPVASQLLAPVVPAPPFHLPVHTRPSPAAWIRANWRE
jgi:hypothetical protein